MHQAAGVICNKHRCSGTLSIIELIVHDAFRYIAMLDGSRATESTTHIGLRHFAQLQTQYMLNNMPCLRLQPKAVDRLARIMVCDDNLIAFTLLNRQLYALLKHHMVYK